MSLALSIAIHKSLIAGLPLGDESILAPYGGCWVPHAHILGIDSACAAADVALQCLYALGSPGCEYLDLLS